MKASAKFVTIVPLLVFAVMIIVTAQPPWTPMRLIGLVLTVFGLTMLTIARVQLGDAFSVAPQATMLVTHGLYHRIRNPVYVVATVVLTGLCLYFNRPGLLIVVAATIPVQVWRARAEGRVLEQRFGEQYREYKRNTWI